MADDRGGALSLPGGVASRALFADGRLGLSTLDGEPVLRTAKAPFAGIEREARHARVHQRGAAGHRDFGRTEAENLAHTSDRVSVLECRGDAVAAMDQRSLLEVAVDAAGQHLVV